MHEMSIAKSIFEIVKGEMERCGAQKIVEIRIRAGVLMGIVPDSLRLSFSFLRIESENLSLTFEIC